jgi:hypothetical protein
MSKSFKSGAFEIELGNELQGYVDRVVKEVLPDTHKALLEEVTELRRYAEAHWPVKPERSEVRLAIMERLAAQGRIKGEINKTSRNSAGKFRHGVRMTPDGLEAFVENKASYAAFIREPSVGKKPGKHQFRQLLFKRFGAKRQNALWAKVAKELG